MDQAKRLADRVLGSRPITVLPRHATRQHLRVLAYHGVFDVDAFRSQLTILATHYAPVSAAEVIAAQHGESRLPDHAVWVTFDDGDPSIIESAIPILEDLDITGTVFVCPGLVDTTPPFWWDIVDAAFALGESWDLDGRRFGGREVRAFTTRLKTLDDDYRREIVATLTDTIVQRTGRPAQRRQVTATQLKDFIAAGGSIGNHTWDHPCLDRLDENAQDAQIVRAHDWLTKRFPQAVQVFAYPNGNYSPIAEGVLRDLGYDVGALFDHRLSRIEGNPFQLSRLRVNDYTTTARFGAILAGVHPDLHAIRSRTRAEEARRK